MSHEGDDHQTDIVRLTKAAAAAAELGRWDAVVQYYRERGALLMAMQTPVRQANDLLKLDERIRDRVCAVQAVLVSLLGEAATTRQRLQGLHQRLEVQPSAPVTVSMRT